MTRENITCVVCLVLIAAVAEADDYSFEIGMSYDQMSLDGEQTITTNAGSIFNSNEIDADDLGIFGSWYFQGLSDEKGPRARAAFVDRASVLSVSYARTDMSFSASITSTDPLVPPFAAEFDTKGDAYVLDGRYVSRQSGWFGSAGFASLDTSIGGFVDESVDATAWNVGFGKYLFDTTTVAVGVSGVDEDGGDATTYALNFSHLGAMGQDWQYAVDLGYSRVDGDADLEVDSWSAALSLYPTRDFEFGLRVSDQDADFSALDRTSYEGFISWFVTPKVVLAARYRVDDVEFLGNVSIPSADVSSDVDQDSVGISVGFRF